MSLRSGARYAPRSRESLGKLRGGLPRRGVLLLAEAPAFQARARPACPRRATASRPPRRRYRRCRSRYRVPPGRARRIDTERIHGRHRKSLAVERNGRSGTLLRAQDQAGERERAARHIRHQHEPATCAERARAAVANGEPQLIATRPDDRYACGVHDAVLDHLLDRSRVERHVETGADVVDLRAVTVEHETDEIHRRRPRAGGTGREREGARVEVQHGANERSASRRVRGEIRGVHADRGGAERRPCRAHQCFSRRWRRR